MKLIYQLFLLAFTCVSPATAAQIQMPEGFHWVDFRKEAAIVTSVASALNSENYTQPYVKSEFLTILHW